MKSTMLLAGTVIAVRENKKTGRKDTYVTKNLVTQDGCQYYAEAVPGSASWAVAGMRLGSDPASADVASGDTDVNSFLAGTGHDIDAGYPVTSDDDTDNTGAATDVVTWRVSYGAAEGNVNSISEVALVDSHGGPTKALCHAVFSSPFNKTSDDTLKVFVNHEMQGS